MYAKFGRNNFRILQTQPQGKMVTNHFLIVPILLVVCVLRAFADHHNYFQKAHISRATWRCQVTKFN